MDERSHNHKNKRFFIRSSIGLILSAAAMIGVQGVCWSGKAQPESEIKKRSSPLTFKVGVSEKNRCQESCVAVKAEVVNESDQAVAIDTNGLKYQIALDKLRILPEGASSRSMTMHGDYGPEQYDESTYKVLEPGQSYKKTFSIPFSGAFFNDSGSYKLSLTYGQFREYTFKGVKLFLGTVKSNEVEFKTQSCSSEKVKKSLKDCN